MNYGIQVINGFCFGLGLILIAFVMNYVFHVGFCHG